MCDSGAIVLCTLNSPYLSFFKPATPFYTGSTKKTCPLLYSWQILFYQVATKGCRLSWLTNSVPRIWAQMRGGGGLRGLSQWVKLYSPNKFWKSNSVFNLCLLGWRWMNNTTTQRHVNGKKTRCSWLVKILRMTTTVYVNFTRTVFSFILV